MAERLCEIFSGDPPTQCPFDGQPDQAPHRSVVGVAVVKWAWGVVFGR